MNDRYDSPQRMSVQCSLYEAENGLPEHWAPLSSLLWRQRGPPNLTEPPMLLRH